MLFFLQEVKEGVSMSLIAYRKPTHVSQLSIGALFFACRLCKYLKVPQLEKRRTDVLRLRSIRFFRNGLEMKHNNLWLEYADCVSITFEF
mmetsp:Transcript_24276/g.35977  ORF Transcript_24276/g.35977 Transcript_24276/m.35977 type:complete len:90 (+) Transcript_24276:1296-1565(+)